MTIRLRRIATTFAMALLVAGCSTGGGGSTTTPVTTARASATPQAAVPSPDASDGDAGSPRASAPAPSVVEPTRVPPTIAAAWAQVELVDVATGERFRIADLAGTTVILETMAIWCSNCRAQQGEVYEALAELDPTRVVYVLLDVDPNETDTGLAEYRSQNGFTGVYAIAGQEVARALRDDFGDQVLNPPSTPMILIGSDGRVTLTPFGHKSAAEVVELARDHGA
jgi:hypothetical protein